MFVILLLKIKKPQHFSAFSIHSVAVSLETLAVRCLVCQTADGEKQQHKCEVGLLESDGECWSCKVCVLCGWHWCNEVIQILILYLWFFLENKQYISSLKKQPILSSSFNFIKCCCETMSRAFVDGWKLAGWRSPSDGVACRNLALAGLLSCCCDWDGQWGLVAGGRRGGCSPMVWVLAHTSLCLCEMRSLLGTCAPWL